MANTSYWVFGTISASIDYSPSDEMIVLLKKAMPQLHCVSELGDSKKEHIHFVGCTDRRLNNLTASIKKRLKDDDIEVSSYTVKLCALPNPYEKLAYIQKEQGHVVIASTQIADKLLQESVELYPISKFSKRTDKDEKKYLSEEKIVRWLIENNCKHQGDISTGLTILKEQNKLSYTSYKKLNMKKLLEYLNDEWNFDK